MSFESRTLVDAPYNVIGELEAGGELDAMSQAALNQQRGGRMKCLTRARVLQSWYVAGDNNSGQSGNGSNSAKARKEEW
jgi:hypothetical protein